jgi:hypothetical protein
MLFALGAVALMASPVLAQTPPPADVAFTAVADMPTLKDAQKLDSFSVELKDAQVDTTLTMSCSAGHSALFGLAHANKVCAFQKGSVGQIFNPKKSTWQPRTQYSGAYTVTGDGSTDAKTMSITYLPQSNSAQFGGSLNLKPELTSSGAAGLRDLVVKKLQSGSTTPVDDRVDTIDFNNFYTPSAGLPSDKGCTWQGNAVFSYQNFSWYMKLSAICDNQRFDFSGNMPFLGDSSQEGTTTYNLVLTLAGADAQTDDALFADSSDDTLFNDVAGISGKITMKNSNIVTVTLDNEPLQTPQHVEASGTISGSGVPLPVVRSFATIIGLLPSTFFGA